MQLTFNGRVTEGQVSRTETLGRVVKNRSALGVDTAGGNGAGTNLVARTDTSGVVGITLTAWVTDTLETADVVLTLGVVGARVPGTFVHVSDAFCVRTTVVVDRALAHSLPVDDSTLGVDTTDTSLTGVDALAVGAGLCVTAVFVSRAL